VLIGEIRVSKASPKKISIQVISLIALSRFIAMEANYESKRKEEQNEFANSVEKNTNPATSHRTSARCVCVAHGRARGRCD
jgi:hypothetical protein